MGIRIGHTQAVKIWQLFISKTQRRDEAVVKIKFVWQRWFSNDQQRVKM
ncbi:hypothetical protein COO91_09401 (plasmid) [Nostoc flagelliforme CCNUN1]|uniref:Uncharacterized protein n=1 Tax=Nostoc flagelliforme CCNUN1 TaxID=2038116 RepID=A0A2K8T689_9NOSO|nr:hypothetical protein COO91_09401 [Nostoc flagelliforme CCNUN1]